MRTPTVRLAIAVVMLLGASACSEATPADDASSPDPAASPTSEATEPAGEPTPEASVAAAGGVADPGNALWFYPPQEGAVLTFRETGVRNASYSGEVVGVSEVAEGVAVAIREDVGDGVTVERTIITTGAGTPTIDPAGFFASDGTFEITSAGDVIPLPSIDEMEAGNSASGETFIEFSGEGFTGRNDMAWTASGAGFESVTVPAGDFDAYVVVIDIDVTSSFGQRNTGTSRFWFVPGFAVVKQVFDIGPNTITVELEASSL